MDETNLPGLMLHALQGLTQSGQVQPSARENPVASVLSNPVANVLSCLIQWSQRDGGETHMPTKFQEVFFSGLLPRASPTTPPVQTGRGGPGFPFFCGGG